MHTIHICACIALCNLISLYVLANKIILKTLLDKDTIEQRRFIE